MRRRASGAIPGPPSAAAVAERPACGPNMDEEGGGGGGGEWRRLCGGGRDGTDDDDDGTGTRPRPLTWP